MSACTTDPSDTTENADIPIAAALPDTDSAQENFESSTTQLPAVEPPAVDAPDENAGENAGETATNEETAESETTTLVVPDPDSPATATSNTPLISFGGTTLIGEYEIGDTILLDGSQSTIENAELTGFQWTQIDNGAPQVTLLDADTATASFVAAADIDGKRLAFELTVNASNGSSYTADLLYGWNINVPSEQPMPSLLTTPTPIPADKTNYILGSAGEYFAESVTSVYIADKDNNEILHVNALDGSLLSTFSVTDEPNELGFVESNRSLYASMEGVGKLVKIKLDTGDLTEISLSGEALSISTSVDRIYYTVDLGSYNFGLFSIGDDDVPVDHGVIDGDLIQYNRVTEELVAVWAGMSPASIYRYEFLASGMVSELQFSRDLGSNARDLAISPDGQQLAVVAGGGNGAGYTIYDILASDLTVATDAWDTDAYPKSADFSKSGSYFAASNDDHLFLFDAATYALTELYDVNENYCGLGYDTLDEVRFSHDDNYLFARLRCGFDKETTVIFFYEVP